MAALHEADERRARRRSVPGAARIALLPQRPQLSRLQCSTCSFMHGSKQKGVWYKSVRGTPCGSWTPYLIRLRRHKETFSMMQPYNSIPFDVSFPDNRTSVHLCYCNNAIVKQQSTAVSKRRVHS